MWCNFLLVVVNGAHILQKTLHHLSVVDDDERILPLLKKLKYRYLGEDFSSVGSQVQGQIQLSQINMVRM